MAAPCTDQALTLETPSGALHGSLRRPDRDDNGTALLLVAGSGPTDRDGNGPGYRNDSLLRLAAGLCDRGLASLRTDKRGVAASATAVEREDALRFDTAVDDAVAWAALLARQPGVARIVLLGHSEGALIAALAAERAAASGLISLAGAGLPAGALLSRQLAASTLSDALKAEAARVLAELEAGRRVAAVAEGLQTIFRPSVQPYLIGWLEHDPAEVLDRQDLPLLLIGGGRDLQIGPADLDRLHAARPDAERLLLPEMNHVLRAVGPDRADNVASYNDPSRPLAPGLVEAIARFVADL